MNKSNLRKVANILTFSRLILGLPIIIFLNLKLISLAWLLLVLGAFTDIFDGWLARKADGGTVLGARLDPLADKIMISAPFIWLTSIRILPAWSIWLLIGRELFISGWRSQVDKGAPASKFGKIKTIAQFMSLLLILWPPNWGSILFVESINRLGIILFWVSLILALISGIQYISFKSDDHQ